MSTRIVKLNNKGLTLVEVLIASLVTLLLFMALMQTALLSMDINAGNVLRDEAVSIAEERMREERDVINNADFNALNDDPDSSGAGIPAQWNLTGADCPQVEFTDIFGTDGRLYQRPYRNREQPVDFCTNVTCTKLGGSANCADTDSDLKQIDITVGWRWQERDHTHIISTVVRRP